VHSVGKIKDLTDKEELRVGAECTNKFLLQITIPANAPNTYGQVVRPSISIRSTYVHKCRMFTYATENISLYGEPQGIGR